VVNVSMNKLGPRLSLPKISAELAARGYTIGRGPKERAEGAPNRQALCGRGYRIDVSRSLKRGKA
jgi:hypothetical protein